MLIVLLDLAFSTSSEKPSGSMSTYLWKTFLRITESPGLYLQDL